MPNQLPQNILNQLKQFGDDVAQETDKVAGTTIEQISGNTPQDPSMNSDQNQQNSASSENASPEKIKAHKDAQRQYDFIKVRRELDEEIKKYETTREQRDVQIKQEEQKIEQLKKEEAEKQTQESTAAPEGKKMGPGAQKDRSAQSASQPETSGKRGSG